MTANSSKFNRMLHVQQQKEWDIAKDIDWNHFDFELSLLPLNQAFRDQLNLTADEELALSQLLGLIAIKAISEHERALHLVKKRCWTQPVKRQQLPQDTIDLGEQFFAEESKHSEAFARYIAKFSEQKQLSMTSLNQILPSYRDGLSCGIFRLNGLMRGRAVWWLVMLTEEESLDLFRKIRSQHAVIDPLFYRLHQLHFQEEVRHISYAPMMLRLLGGGRVARFDYRLAEVMHFLWILAQLCRVRRIKKFSQEHVFFATLARVGEKFSHLSFNAKWQLVFHQTPFLSDLFRPLRHKAMRIELKRNLDLPSLFKQAH